MENKKVYLVTRHDADDIYGKVVGVAAGVRQALSVIYDEIKNIDVDNDIANYGIEVMYGTLLPESKVSEYIDMVEKYIALTGGEDDNP